MSALLFQQDYDGDAIEMEDDETFEIPEEAEGQILDDEPYYINVEVFEDEFDKEKIKWNLRSGLYRLEGFLIISEG